MDLVGDGGTELSRRARRWLEEHGCSVDLLDWLGGDVSSRRYWRAELAAGGSRILVWYPDEIRDAAERFRVTTGLLSTAGIRVPWIEAFDAPWMLLEDLGVETLYDRRRWSWKELTVSLEEAARLLAPMQGIRLPEEWIEPLDGALLARELDLTWESFLEPAGLSRERGLGRDLQELLVAVCGVLDRAPRVPCHRDFMARNLIPLGGSGEGLGVLDHQDLRAGPAAYDLASLLNDSLYPPPELRDRLLTDLLGERRNGYWCCVVQRTLKIVGTFHRFARRGQPRYLGLVTPSLARTLEALQELPAFDGPGLARALRAHGLGNAVG